MLDGWEARATQGRPLDVALEMPLLAQRIIVRTMFGTDLGEEGARIARAFDTALAGIDARFVVPLWVSRLPLPANRRFEKALATIDGAVRRIIAGRRRDGREGGSDLLGMLMEARDAETGETMSEGQIRDEVTTIYLAGHETTAVTLAWTWYLLSKNPAVARRPRRGLAGPRRQDARHRGLAEPDLHADGRGRGPAAVSRGVDDLAHSGRGRRDRRLPHPRRPHRLPEPLRHPPPPRAVAQPRGLRPRALRPESGSGRPRFAYFPFGGGPRLCIGNNFALTEATLVIAMTAQRYRLDLVPGQTVKAKPRGTLRPRPAVWMTPHLAS